jgi:hypothetical protein
MAREQARVEGARVTRDVAGLQAIQPPLATPTSPQRIVELCGLPGSGKSHVASVLARALLARGHEPHDVRASLGPDVGAALRVPRKLSAAVTATLAEPGAAVAIGAAVIRSQRTIAARASRSLQWLVTQELLRRARRDGGVYVLDEGVVQALWSIGLRGDVERVVEALDSEPAWIGPDVLLVVRATPAAADRRLSARASTHSRTQRLPADDRLAELERGEELLDLLISWWTRSIPAEAAIVEIRNDDDEPREAEAAELAERFVHS